ncbi:MAG: FdrA family protein [Frankiaceae bacterium]
MTATVEVRTGAYYDSVTLMRVSRTVGEVDGVDAALVAMATELNLDLLAEMGFDRPAAGPNDLVVAVRAGDDEQVAAARAVLDRELAELSRRAAEGAGAASGAASARSVRAAARAVAAAGTPGIALVSVPGRYAFAEAMDALEAGLCVMLFSDNVPVEQEVLLKDVASDIGLLVMGPDCGTAHVSGVGLGFANVVSPGPVGIVAASGTGAQQLMCLLDAAGVGVSHVLGVGGRDLSARVGARSTLPAMGALGLDPATRVVVVVSKPAAVQAGARVRGIAAAMPKPVITALLGQGFDDLTAVVEQVLATLGVEPPTWPCLPPDDVAPPAPGALRGLFAGGTLCDEAMVIASEQLGEIRSNIPLEPEWALPRDLSGGGHLMIDFGDDRLTAGRPHPMVDSTLRLARLAVEASDPEVSVVLLDVVLGHGAHPDPAAELAPAVRAARAAAAAQGRRLAVVVSLCGTRGDPQGYDRQAAALRDAGAWVLLSNAAAARHAVALCRGVAP